MTSRPILILALVLAACGATNEPRYRIDPAPSAQRTRIAVGTLEVRDVSLPGYATEPDMLAESPDGALYKVGDSLWADDQTRGVTSALVEALSARTTATVTGEPWPLTEPAQVQLDVRVAQIYARADGSFELSGQYAVASRDAVVREFVRGFDIRVPLAGEGSGAIAAAQSAAIATLADQIARALR